MRDYIAAYKESSPPLPCDFVPLPFSRGSCGWFDRSAPTFPHQKQPTKALAAYAHPQPTAAMPSRATAPQHASGSPRRAREAEPVARSLPSPSQAAARSTGRTTARFPHRPPPLRTLSQLGCRSSQTGAQSQASNCAPSFPQHLPLPSFPTPLVLLSLGPLQSLRTALVRLLDPL